MKSKSAILSDNKEKISLIDYNISLLIADIVDGYEFDFSLYTNNDANCEIEYPLDALNEDEIYELIKIFNKYDMFTIYDNNLKLEISIYKQDGFVLSISLIDLKYDSSVAYKQKDYKIIVDRENKDFIKFEILIKLIKLNEKRRVISECKSNTVKY